MGEEQKINNNNLNYIGKEKHVSRCHTLFFQRCDSALVERGTWRRKAAGCFPRRLFHGVLLAARLSLYCFAQKGGSGVLGTIFPSPFSSMHVCGSVIVQVIVFCLTSLQRRLMESMRIPDAARDQSSTSSHACPGAADRVGANTNHAVPSQHLPVPAARISVQLRVRGQAKREDAYGDIRCTHRQRKEGKAESSNLGLWRRTL